MTPRNEEHDLQRQGALAFEGGTPRENCPYAADTYQAAEFARGWDAACLEAGGPEKQPKPQWQEARGK